MLLLLTSKQWLPAIIQFGPQKSEISPFLSRTALQEQVLSLERAPRQEGLRIQEGGKLDEGYHLHLLPRLNSSPQEEGKSCRSSSSGAIEGDSREQDTQSNEAGATQGHGGAPAVAGLWRRAVVKHPANNSQGLLSARQRTGRILKQGWKEERFS